jgi:hypothetical protein
MKEILKFFEHILNSVDNGDDHSVPNVNPTEIFNEGWMTRLLVYQSIKEKLIIDGLIDFVKNKNWSSEGLISSPFVKAKKNREGYTHADMTLGDFAIDYKGRGEITVSDSAINFGIIEAKMGRNLSQGTTHAPDYNQASRNLACIAENVKNETCKTFFTVVAPITMIKHHKIMEQTEKGFMIKQIKHRFELSDMAIDNDLIERANQCLIKVLSYAIGLICYQKAIEVLLKNSMLIV